MDVSSGDFRNLYGTAFFCLDDLDFTGDFIVISSGERMVSGEEVSCDSRYLEYHSIFASVVAVAWYEISMACTLPDGAPGCLSGAERASAEFHVLFFEPLRREM